MVWFSDEWQYWMGMPYYEEATGKLVDRYGTLDGILIRNAHMGAPWSYIVGIFASIITVDVGLHMAFRLLKRPRTLAKPMDEL